MNITGTIFDSYFKNSTLEVSGKNGTRIYSLGVAPAGYKLLNPEVLVEYFTMDGNAAFINGKDVDLTLKYAPISQVLIRYVDRDTGQEFHLRCLTVIHPAQLVIFITMATNSILRLQNLKQLQLTSQVTN